MNVIKVHSGTPNIHQPLGTQNHLHSVAISSTSKGINQTPSYSLTVSPQARSLHDEGVAPERKVLQAIGINDTPVFSEERLAAAAENGIDLMTLHEKLIGRKAQAFQERLVNVGTEDNPLFTITVGDRTWVSRTADVTSRSDMELLGPDTDLEGLHQETLDTLDALRQLSAGSGMMGVGVDSRLHLTIANANASPILSARESIQDSVGLLYKASNQGTFASEESRNKAFALLLGQQFVDIGRRHNQHYRLTTTPEQLEQLREQAQAFSNHFFASLADHDFETAFELAWYSINPER